jgi:N-acetylglutamate synthase-like GNAT family acetyltransferase
MKIIDLTPAHEELYFCCLEPWSDEIKEAGDHKACWYRQMKDKGLKVKLAREDDGTITGMIQYLPSELTGVEGKEMYHILCIWVHGHKQGIGNHQKRGTGKALLKAAEEDVMNSGAKGISAWGIVLPFFMRAAWFKKHGFKVADKNGIIRLLWKPFQAEALPPVFIKQEKKPLLKQGKVNVSLFLSGWCPAQNILYERTRRAMSGYEEFIELNDYNTNNPDVFKEWGISEAVYVDNKEIRNGPPVPYKKIRRVIEKGVKKVKRV